MALLLGKKEIRGWLFPSGSPAPAWLGLAAPGSLGTEEEVEEGCAGGGLGDVSMFQPQRPCGSSEAPGLNGSKLGLDASHPAAEADPACGAAGAWPWLSSSTVLLPRLPLSGEIYEGLITAIRNRE